MKPSIYRRMCRRTASHEAANANKESKQEHSFFGEASHETFFQPSRVIQRKYEKCEEEDKKVQRQQDKKEDDKKLQRVTEKKEEDIVAPVSLPDITTYGHPASESAYGKSVRFDGKTDADFDGGVGQTKNLKAIPAKECKDCSASECMTVTGSFEITYTVTTSVMLPDMPEGLTPCQQKRVKDAIDGVLAPHEQKHVKAFETYNGKVTLPITYTGCKDGLQPYLQDLNDADGIKRKAAAKAKSDALDPFFVNVDLDCVEPVPPKK